jgi:hypothetical protein
MLKEAPTIPATYHIEILAQGGKKAHLDAPPATTIGQLRETALNALQIQRDPSVVWFLHYRGEQLNNDAATLAEVIGHHASHERVVMHLKKQPFAGASAPATVISEPTAAYIAQSVEALQARSEEFAIATIVVDGVDVFVTLLARSLNAMRDRYTVRLRCDGYNVEPPAVTMVDPKNRAETVTAWPNVPVGPGAIFRLNPGNIADSFICVPGTREWYSHGHGEFRSPEYWELANIIEAIAFALNSTGYTGRWQS